jgi:hypothetical protein
MSFRLRMLGIHLLASACVLSLVLGGMFLGWYRWPGWYLAGAGTVSLVVAGVDLALGPCLTGIIASPTKPRRELARDIAIIASIQLLALGYGSFRLWEGRPLYYAFSENMLQLVQAYDIDGPERDLALQRNPDLAPHWYDRPRWIWAPLPDDPAENSRILQAAIAGGTDVIGMPRYFHPWEQGAEALRAQLQPVGKIRFLGLAEQKRAARRMQDAGLSPDHPNAIFFLGRGKRLLAVFEPTTLRLITLIRVD